MSIIKSNMTAPPHSGGALSSIEEMNSLRFDGSSYLTRTFAGSNTNLFTISTWIKISKFQQSCILGRSDSIGNWHEGFRYESFNKFRNLGAGSTTNKLTKGVFRDTSAWYHVIFQVKSGLNIYVNGKLQECDGTRPSNYSGSGSYCVNRSGLHAIGKLHAYNGAWLNGYLADYYFIDGDVSNVDTAFGEEISGVWVPKAYDPATSGDYGTNGFHLDFADSGNIGNDVSGNGNHWTVN